MKHILHLLIIGIFIDHLFKLLKKIIIIILVPLKIILNRVGYMSYST